MNLFASDPKHILQEVDAGFSGFSIADSNNLWAIGYEGEQPGEHVHVVLHSKDGGCSWSRQFADATDHFFGIFFFNPQLGWVVGSGGTILKTSDGGRSWVRQTTRTSSTLHRVQFITRETGWALGFDGELLRTIDGGANWRSHKLKISGLLGNKSSGDLTSLSFRDDLDGWIVGERGQIYESTDGGASWQPRMPQIASLVENGQSGNVDFKEVSFFDSNRGLIIAQTSPDNQGDSSKRIVVLRTLDGGRNWVGTKLTASGFVRAQFLESSIWIEIDYGRSLLNSADGGNTWVRVAVPREVDYPLMYFLDAYRGWIVSSFDAFSDIAFYTRDGGKTWSSYKLRTNIKQ